MPINAINSVKPTVSAPAKKKHTYVKTTGYLAVAAGVGSGFAAKAKRFGLHTKLAYIAGLLTAAHIFIIEYAHYKYKRTQK